MEKVLDKRTNRLRINNCYQAQTLYDKLREATETKIPLDNTSPMIYTERKDGVLAGYDIRTDRWEIAQEQMGKAHKRDTAMRDALVKNESKEGGESQVSQ